MLTILFLILVSFPITMLAQNTITYTSPSENFIDITIQAHNGLPRFGNIHYTPKTIPLLNQKAYEDLLILKYLAPVYADIDKEKLTKGSNDNSDLKTKNSSFSQQHLLYLLNKIGTDAFIEKYFCDVTNTKIKCNAKDGNKQRRFIGYWGGSISNEFRQMSSYKEVVNNHLSELQNWSNTLFKEDQETAYFVTQSIISGTYDFKHKGFWLEAIGTTNFMIQKNQLIANTDNEKKLRHQKIFLAIDPAKAKALNIQKMTPIFTVFKVKIIPKVTKPTYIEFPFELVSKTIEVYRDPNLTTKMGEIAIENANFKY